jgi:ribosomal peptide maturation radical SAM protein 1
MPFGSCFRPSVHLGLLKAIGRQAGFRVDDYHMNLDLAGELGPDVYEAIRGDVYCADCTGEWVFTIAAFGEEHGRADYFDAFPFEAERIAEAIGKDGVYLGELRERIMPEFIDACLERADWGSYEAVGFISALQQQTIASLALARRIKERYPHVAIFLFGYNMDGEMGVEHVRAFPYIDFALSGELEELFPKLLERLSDSGAIGDLQGVASRDGNAVSFIGPASPVTDLDSLPVPDYDTFYGTAERNGISKFAESIADPYERLNATATPVEGSRGCWWGEKSHCTFCGVNRTSMKFRSKSAARLLAEVDQLAARYGRKRFHAVDWIMDPEHIRGLFGALADRDDCYEFFYFSKSNLTRDQVRLLARGGLRLIFPGIESLNTHILQLMRKGVTRLQNVNLLRWCSYYHIGTSWNLVYGFPGERSDDYAEQLETLRLTTHLHPPMECVRVRLDRFSPNFFDAHLFPVKWRRPDAGYSYIYPPEVNLEEVAFFFEYEPECDVLPEEALQATKDFIFDRKNGRYGICPSLTYRCVSSGIEIEDTRLGPDARRSYSLAGPDAAVYEACSSAPRSPGQVCAALSSASPSAALDVDSVDSVCEGLCEAGLMIGEAGRYLSLAIPADPER